MKLFTLTDKGLLAGAEIILNCQEHIAGLEVADPLAMKIKAKVEKLIEERGEGTVTGTRYLLGAADLQNDTLIEEEWPKDRRCLLLVDLYPGEGGKVEFTANVHQEYHDNATGVVRREFLPLSYATGVKVISETTGPFPQTLLMLTPGCRFRVRRTGDVRDESGRICLPEELKVEWSGWWSAKATNPDPISPPAAQSYRQFGMTVNFG